MLDVPWLAVELREWFASTRSTLFLSLLTSLTSPSLSLHSSLSLLLLGERSSLHLSPIIMWDRKVKSKERWTVWTPLETEPWVLMTIDRQHPVTSRSSSDFSSIQGTRLAWVRASSLTCPTSLGEHSFTFLTPLTAFPVRAWESRFERTNNLDEWSKHNEPQAGTNGPWPWHLLFAPRSSNASFHCGSSWIDWHLLIGLVTLHSPKWARHETIRKTLWDWYSDDWLPLMWLTGCRMHLLLVEPVDCAIGLVNLAHRCSRG